MQMVIVLIGKNTFNVFFIYLFIVADFCEQITFIYHFVGVLQTYCWSIICVIINNEKDMKCIQAK